MHYPEIDPIIFALGPIAVRWYGLSYLAGFAVVWWLGRRRAKTHPGAWTDEQLADLVFYGALGAVLGGRMGYVFFYNLQTFLNDPLYLVRLWEGGMSFHGGLLGTICGVWWFARKTGRRWIDVTDFLAPLTPIGLGFGRLANFINGELPGRITDSPLGMIYPCDTVVAINPMCVGAWESVARHPSPLYQAATDGILLFALLWLISAKPRPSGFVSGMFLIAYGSLRFFTEWFRAPDAHIGFIAFEWLTMGQTLSLPMIIAGILLLRWSRGQSAVQAASNHR